jgi:ribonuclease P protein component
MERRYRLRSRGDFARLREQGRVCRHAWLNISVVRNELSHNRYGYITGKTLGNAVQRNRVRRLLRESVRRLHERLQPGFDILLIARPAIVNRTLAEIVQVLEELARQAGVLKAEA